MADTDAWPKFADLPSFEKTGDSHAWDAAEINSARSIC
jgi:hypothetical protein